MLLFFLYLFRVFFYHHRVRASHCSGPSLCLSLSFYLCVCVCMLPLFFIGSIRWMSKKEKKTEPGSQNQLNDLSHHSFSDIVRHGLPLSHYSVCVCLFHSFIQWFSFSFVNIPIDICNTYIFFAITKKIPSKWRQCRQRRQWRSTTHTRRKCHCGKS